MGTEQHEAASQKPDASKKMGEFMPLKEGGEKTREKAEKAFDQAKDKIVKKYSEAVRGAKDFDDAEAKVKKATDQLDKELQSLNKHVAGLPKEYSKTYQSALKWNNQKLTFGVDFDLKIKVVDGRLAANYLSYPWDDSAGSVRDWGE